MVVSSIKKMVITSTILTIIVFSLGIALGIGLDQLREDDVFDNLRRSELNTESYLVEQGFISSFGGDVCTALSSRTADIKFITKEIGQQLSRYTEKNFVLTRDLDYLKRKYFISEIKFLTLINDLNKNCNTNYVPVLFFYTKDDTISSRQGYILSDLSEEYKQDLIVLSIDKDYEDEPLVKMLKTRHDIVKDSTLIIDNDIKIEEFISKEDLKKVIDSRLTS